MSGFNTSDDRSLITVKQWERLALVLERLWPDHDNTERSLGEWRDYTHDEDIQRLLIAGDGWVIPTSDSLTTEALEVRLALCPIRGGVDFIIRARTIVASAMIRFTDGEFAVFNKTGVIPRTHEEAASDKAEYERQTKAKADIVGAVCDGVGKVITHKEVVAMARNLRMGDDTA